MKQISKQQVIGATLILIGAAYLILKLLVWAIDSSTYL